MTTSTRVSVAASTVARMSSNVTPAWAATVSGSNPISRWVPLLRAGRTSMKSRALRQKLNAFAGDASCTARPVATTSATK